jgi:hypothetical protein
VKKEKISKKKADELQRKLDIKNALDDRLILREYQKVESEQQKN